MVVWRRRRCWRVVWGEKGGRELGWEIVLVIRDVCGEGMRYGLESKRVLGVEFGNEFGPQKRVWERVWERVWVPKEPLGEVLFIIWGL